MPLRERSRGYIGSIYIPVPLIVTEMTGRTEWEQRSKKNGKGGQIIIQRRWMQIFRMNRENHDYWSSRAESFCEHSLSVGGYKAKKPISAFVGGISTFRKQIRSFP